jgi:Skp family chaperone for outer membrane proteins
MKTVLIVAALATVSSLHPAAAQTPSQTSAQGAAAQPLGGPLVAGVCLLSREAVFANAKVGQAATARLRELTQQAEAEVDAERKPLVADAQALQAQRASLKQAEQEKRAEALAVRQQALTAKAQQRSRELELTREKALAQIADQAQPAIAAAYKAKACGLLLNRDGVLGGNMGDDLTTEVIRGLDARMTTITFDRATLPAQPAGAAR